MPHPPAALAPRFTPDLLDDDDELHEAVLAYLTMHAAEENSTRRLADIELDVIRARLDPQEREQLDHAVGLLDRAEEEAALAVAMEILQSASRFLPRVSHLGLVDPQRLADALDEVVRNAPEVRRLTRRVLRLQERVRARVDGPSWRLFLRWEEAVTGRAAAAQDAIARWAYAEGWASCAARGTPGDPGAPAQGPRRRGRGGAP